MLVVDAHETDRAPEIGRPPASGQLETEHLAIKVDGAIGVADVDADMADPAETNTHGTPSLLPRLRSAPAHRDDEQSRKRQHHLAVAAQRISATDLVDVSGKERLACDGVKRRQHLP